MRKVFLTLALIAGVFASGGMIHTASAEPAPSAVTAMLQAHPTTKAAKVNNTPAENQMIRDLGGIPPCKWEDGSGQPGMCYFVDDSKVHLINVPTTPGADKRSVIIKRG